MSDIKRKPKRVSLVLGFIFGLALLLGSVALLGLLTKLIMKLFMMGFNAWN